MIDVQNRKNYVILMVESIIIFIVHILNINNLFGFFLSEDELGYWGNAAFFLGKDWESAVSYCPYYSYGYSFFLMLIMSLPISSLMMYRFAIVSNSLFMVVSFFISYYLFTCLFPEKSKKNISVACMSMALYASYVTQSSVTWAECYLILFVWLLLLQAYWVCMKTTIARVTVFVIELVYIYRIHQRTIPFIIAGAFLILLLAVHKKVSVSMKQLILMGIIIVGIVCISFVLKGQIKVLMGEGNDYASYISQMSFSDFFIPVIREISGQFFYLWAASFGIIPLGIGVTVVLCFNKWKEKDQISYFYAFIVLEFIGILGVSSIAMRKADNRVDYLIYGRYVEIAIGFFIIIGFLYLSDFVGWKKSKVVFFISSIAFVSLAFFLINKIKVWNISLDTYYQGVCAPAVYWFYSLRGFQVKELCFLVLIVEAVIFVVAKICMIKRYIFSVLVIIISFFWIKAGDIVIKQQICPYQTAYIEAVAMKADLWNYIEEHYDYAVFLSNTPYNIRGTIQFYMQDIPLICVHSLKELNYLPELLIIDNDDSIINGNELEEYYFVSMVGQKSVYSLNKINMGNLQGEIDQNQFSHNKIDFEEAGYIMYGPYIRLKPGTYDVIFHMNISFDVPGNLGVLDVVSSYGDNVICSTTWDGTFQTVSMRFRLEEETSGIEFRYYKYAGNDTMPTKVILNGVKD